MATVINNPGNDGGGASGIIIGVIVAIIILVLFFVFVLPSLSDRQRGRDDRGGSVDVNVQIPTGDDRGGDSGNRGPGN